jgi:hypothetical protein
MISFPMSSSDLIRGPSSVERAAGWVLGFAARPEDDKLCGGAAA